MKKFVKFVKNRLPGEKNGRKIGNTFFTVVNDVEEVKTKVKHDPSDMLN